MRIAMIFMGGGLMTMLLGLIMFLTSFNYFADDIKKRVYPDGNTQPLATVCQVDKKIEKATFNKETNKFAGYFYKGDKQINCDISDKTDTDIKVIYVTTAPEGTEWVSFANGYGNYYKNYKWIPKKDFHRYHNLSQVSKEELKKILK